MANLSVSSTKSCGIPSADSCLAELEAGYHQIQRSQREDFNNILLGVLTIHLDAETMREAVVSALTYMRR